jgi:hypothetical protein
LERFGIRRPSIAPAINELETLGFIDVVERGGSAHAEYRNPSRYLLAWIDRKDGTPPTNRWKAFETVADARTAVRRVLAGPKRNKTTARKRKDKSAMPGTKTSITKDEIVAGAGHGCVTSFKEEPDTKPSQLSRFSVYPAQQLSAAKACGVAATQQQHEDADHENQTSPPGFEDSLARGSGAADAADGGHG